MALIKEYFDITKQYNDDYGENTILLMMVGSFFEVYGILKKSKSDSFPWKQAKEGKILLKGLPSDLLPIRDLKEYPENKDNALLTLFLTALLNKSIAIECNSA
jgi:hypothetical protein